MDRPKIIAIEWVDPDSISGWKDPAKLHEVEGSVVVSVGMLVREDDTYLYIAMDWAKDGDVNTVGRIRRELISKRKEVNLPKGIWPEVKYPKKAKDNDMPSV
jgi:hypothetical protein